jgi:2',3'-cyclic-nucleotide 2'-phosphodiesterase (5'-nucleotidase family)
MVIFPNIIRIGFLFLGLITLSCQTQYQVKNHSSQAFALSATDTPQVLDQAVIKLITPYKEKLDGQMNTRIMVASADLVKENPEGSLGNMVCDVMMRFATSQGKMPDVCVFNAGGLRIPTIYKGDITIRTIFELLPFDNQLVMVKLSGAQLKELLDLVAANGGWPVAGLQMKIAQKQAVNVIINQNILDDKAQYWVLTSDYLADGGDNAAMLKTASERYTFNFLLRDALIMQLKSMFYDGETLQALKDGRITKE